MRRPAADWYKVTVTPGMVANLGLLARSIEESVAVASVTRETTTTSLHDERELTVNVDSPESWEEVDVWLAIKHAARKNGHRMIWIDDEAVKL